MCCRKAVVYRASSNFNQVARAFKLEFYKMVENPVTDFKRKKKRSFLQKQRRFAKNGSFGQGTQLSSDMYGYFMDILKVMNRAKEDKEEMGTLSSSIFNEIEGKEEEFCCNQLVSRVIETLLPHSTDDDFLKFLDKFSRNLRRTFCDKFGSHVLEQTLIVSYVKYTRCSSIESDNKLSVKFLEHIKKVSNFLLNNVEDFIWNTYSNAVARTIFNVLSGYPVKGEIKVFQRREDMGANLPPIEFQNMISKFIKKILMWPHFNDLCNKPLGSQFLQSMLNASEGLEENSEIVNRIIDSYESNPIDLMEEDNYLFARLLEVVLRVAKEDCLNRIYAVFFKDKIVQLAKSKSGNFAVQKLITFCKIADIFKEIFASLSTHMKDILDVGHSGVLLAIVKGCRNMKILQGNCEGMLSTIFNSKDKKDIVPLIISLSPSENFDPDSFAVTLNGSLIVEEMLNFKKPINVVNSILQLPEALLVKILNDSKGSHITDAFVTSSSVGEKSRDKLFKKLQGHYFTLATSKYGSHSLDAIWSVINVQRKALLAEELKDKERELCSYTHGKGFCRKIRLNNFKRNKDEWIKLQKTSATAEKHFSDIIPKKKQKIV